MEGRPILPLEPKSVSLLRSTLVIPSFPAILVEFVQNSLDAGAGSISLYLDLDRWSIKCEDDGNGMASTDLERIAGGERYWTSKLGDGLEIGQVDTFGFRGEALASIADVSTLEVLTRSRRDVEGESYSLILKDGERLCSGAAGTRRNGPGTTVWARDVFSRVRAPLLAQWPVRRRPSSTPAGRLALLTSFRNSLATLALLHPLVSFNLVDSSTTDSKRLLSVNRMREGVLGRWRQLWGRAGVEKVYEFEESEGSFSASGFFSLTASHSKGSQFVYVNARPLAASPLHKIINQTVAQSTFARHASSHLAPPNTSPSKPVGTTSLRKSPKKTAERHPIFVLNLTIPPGMIDVTLEPEKRVIEFEDTDRVHDFVKSVVNDFLRKNDFLPSAPPKVAPVRSPLPPGSSLLERLKHTTATKSRQSISPSPVEPATPAPTPEAIRAVNSLVERLDPPVKRRLLGAGIEIQVFPEESTQDIPGIAVDEAEPIRWTDPSTLQNLLVDPRTGNSWRPGFTLINRDVACDSCHSPTIEQRPFRRNGIVDKSSLKRRTLVDGVMEDKPSWMTESLANWENPVFPNVSRRIAALPAAPRLDFSAAPANAQSNPQPTAPRARAGIKSLRSFFDSSTIPGISSSDLRDDGEKITKSGLASAEFIAQVDRKFLLIKISSDEEEQATLILVDQHAASERVRVEKMLEEYCGAVAEGKEVKLRRFEKPIPVLIGRAELVSLSERLEEFSRWGIGLVLDTPAEDPTTDYAQIYLTSVPAVVADRLAVEPRLQQGLIRSHLAQLVVAPPSTRILSMKASGSVVKDCPPVILDLINSKACRGAIMFNDELTEIQSTNLLQQLALTDFPFQCAHGRPSLVPLINLPPRTTFPERNIDWTRMK